MTLLDAYDAMRAQHAVTPALHHEFWEMVGMYAGMSPSYARQRAAALGWPTTVAELGLLRRYAGKPKKPPPPKRGHDKTTLAMVQRAIARLTGQPETEARRGALDALRQAAAALGEP